MIDMDRDKTEKANRIRQTVINKVRDMLSEIVDQNGEDIKPFLHDIQKVIPPDKVEEAQATLKKIVILGLLQELVGIELFAYLEQINEYLPDDPPAMPTEVSPPSQVVIN
jgi:hypothetical protein